MTGHIHSNTCVRARKPGLWALLCLAAYLLLAGHAAALEPGNTATEGAGRQRFATVWRLSGTLSAAFGDAAQAHALRPGDVVYVGDRLEADAHSDALLQTEDAGYIAVRAGARLSVDQFVAEKKDTDRFTLRLLQGSLRLISGWVAKLHPQSYRIITPTATVGIRGTDHETYVLTEEMALALGQSAGTYDKVNRGATSLQTSAGSVDIAPGQAGFARLAKPRKTRALITLILPVLLDKVPDFYVPGAFDAQLDALPEQPTADAELRLTPAPLLARPVAEPPDVLAASPTTPSSPAPPATLAKGACNAQAVASAWLDALDRAIARNDAPAVLALFAQEAEVSGTVKNSQGGDTTVRMGREEFAASSLAALNSLGNYSQRRLSLAARALKPGDCTVVALSSVVVEQGTQGGKPYRFTTREQYQLALRDGRWQATRAHTRQQ